MKEQRKPLLPGSVLHFPPPFPIKKAVGRPGRGGGARDLVQVLGFGKGVASGVFEK